MARNILWVDTETTGLDPTTSALLEIGMVVTTELDLQVLGQLSYIWPTDTPVQDLWARTDPYVQEMHTENGLWAEVYQEQEARKAQQIPAQTRYAQIMAEVYYGLAQLGISVSSGAIMAGRNPSFDRGFLRTHAPELMKLFDFHTLDVCSIQMRHAIRGGQRYSVKQTHRALPDCLNEIEELRFYEA